MSKWIKVSDDLPASNVYVALKNVHNEDQPPVVGWAVYWQPKNEFAEFVVDEDYKSDYGSDFTHWLDLSEG